jgi:hypothetical protein
MPGDDFHSVLGVSNGPWGNARVTWEQSLGSNLASVQISTGAPRIGWMRWPGTGVTWTPPLNSIYSIRGPPDHGPD